MIFPSVLPLDKHVICVYNAYIWIHANKHSSPCVIYVFMYCKAMNRVPATLQAGVKKFFCGPESFTPDLAPAFGETPEVQNYFVAAGMNSIGILTGEIFHIYASYPLY